ncbi:MAG: hypothetical protein JWL87_438 [Candidatus Adlerbacteria bacterium]|nr:hypothetical protein [Candidatus Adlerbacteria bacterium]
MLYQAILALHLLATIATLVAIGYALYSVVRKREDSYARAALWLGGIAAFEVLTGTALAVLSPTLLASSLVMHIALYLGVCVGVEALVFARMKQVSRLLPVEVAASPVLASLCFIVAVSLGL